MAASLKLQGQRAGAEPGTSVKGTTGKPRAVQRQSFAFRSLPFWPELDG